MLLLLIIALLQEPLNNFPEWLISYKLQIHSIYYSMLGGILYCLRAVYLEKCVKNRWDSNWETWYYIRPIVSALIGCIVYILLKVGLLVLEAEQIINPTNYGFLAVSFIAGLNGNKFLNLIHLPQVIKNKN